MKISSKQGSLCNQDSGRGGGGVNKGLPIGGLHLYRQKSNFILVSITNKFNMLISITNMFIIKCHLNLCVQTS